MTQLITDPPPEYKKCCETETLIAGSTVMNAGHDNVVYVKEVDPEDNQSEGEPRRSPSICIHLLFLTLSAIFIGCVLYYCLAISTRASSHGGVHVYMKKEIQPPVVINIIQQKVILIKELESQAQPGILTSFKNNTNDFHSNGHTYLERTTPKPHTEFYQYPTEGRRPYRYRTTPERPYRYGTTPERPYRYGTTPEQRRPHRYITTPEETRPHRYGDNPKEGRPYRYGTIPEERTTIKPEIEGEKPYFDEADDGPFEPQPVTGGYYCLDVFTCFSYDIVPEPMTWHNAFRHCRERNGHLPGRDIYYELQLIGDFPPFMMRLSKEGVWSSGKVVHGHYQFLDRAPGFAYAIYGPTLRGLECSKFFIDEKSNMTTFRQENCRKQLRAVCLYPMRHYDEDYVKNVVPSLEVKTEKGDSLSSIADYPSRGRIEKNTKAPFSVHHRQTTKNRPSIEVEDYQMETIELTCNNVPEHKVIWVKDGIFFKNGVSTTKLFRTPNTLGGAYSRQGTYWCEMWKENSTERIASEKIYIHAGLATVSMILKKRDYNLRDIECGLNASPLGCSLEQNDCWYWGTVCSLQDYLGRSFWYPVEETLTFNQGIMSSRATIQFFLPKKTLDRVDWSQIEFDKNSTISIIHATVYEP